MIELRVLEILTERQLTKYWLQKHSGISYQNISKMVNNETTSIHFENIEKLCRALECTPNNIFKITPTETEKDSRVETRREPERKRGSKTEKEPETIEETTTENEIEIREGSNIGGETATGETATEETATEEAATKENTNISEEMNTKQI